MEFSLELNPEKTLFVLGPCFAASLLREGAGPGEGGRSLPPLSYASLRKSLKEAGLSSNRRSRSNKGAEELDAQQGKRRLEDVFSGPSREQLQKTQLAESLLGLQQEGALLVYLHPDSLCEEAMGLTAFTLSETESWTRSRAGLLHPFGVHTSPESLHVPPPSRSRSNEISIPQELSEVLKERSCICLGLYPSGKDEPDPGNPLVDKFLDWIHSYSGSLPTIIHDNSTASIAASSTNAELHIHNVPLPQGLCHISETSKVVGQAINFPPQVEETVSISLVLGNKSGLSHVMDIVSRFPGVNFVISGNLQAMGLEFHPLSVRLTTKNFTEFWETLMSPKTLSELVENSVLFIVLRNGPTIWLNNTGSKSFYNSKIKGRTVEDVVKSSSLQPPPLSNKTTTRQIPRWYTTTRKVNSSTSGASKDSLGVLKDDSTPVLSSILKDGKDGRRKSLPLPSSFSSSIKTKFPSNNPITVTSRQQLLISKYLFTRKHKETDPAANSTLLRSLLSGEPKAFPKSNKVKSSTMELLEKWTTERRKNLYIKENSAWSSCVDKALKRKMEKWEKIRARRRQRSIEREAKASSISSSNSEDLRQHLTSPVTYSPLQASHSISPSLLSPINPFLFPTAAANTLSLHTSPLVYPTSFLSSYPYLTPAALPYVQATTVLPQVTPPSLSASSIFGGAATLAATPVTTATPVLSRNGQMYHSAHYAGSVMADSSSQTVNSRKRSSSSQKTSSSSSSISALLKQEQELPSTVSKRQRLTTVSPSLSYMDDRSDGEEERTPPPSSSSRRDGELWQFLLDLLLSNIHSDWIQWSPQVTMEFSIKKPKDVARLWNTYVGSETESKDTTKFKHALGFCLRKSPPIMYSVEGKPNTYRFSQSVLYYINMRYTQQLEGDFISKKLNTDNSREMSRSREVLVVD